MASFIQNLVSNQKNQYDQSLLQFLDSQKKVSLQWLQVADEQRIAANNFMMYGRPLGDDLTDVTGKMGNLLNTWVQVVRDFSETCDQFQMTMKSIADRESTLFRSREKRRKLQEALTNLERDHPAAVEKQMELKDKLRRANEASAADECEMDNFKRVAVRESMYLFLNGMHEFASKTDLVSVFGKYVADELDVAPIKCHEERKPYQGSEQTSRIVKDASQAIEGWTPDNAKLRRTLTAHHGTNPLIAQQKALPPAPSESSSTTSASNSTSRRPPPPLTSQDSTFSLHKPDAAETTPVDQLQQHRVSPVPSASTSTSGNNQPSPSNSSGLYPSPSTSQKRPLSSSSTGPPQPAPSSSTQTASASHYAGGFSTVYLGLPDHQKLYQFYTNYSPPRTYEEMMTHTFDSNAVFHPNVGGQQQPGARVDAGGFALPGNQFLHPSQSTSTSTSSQRQPQKPSGHHRHTSSVSSTSSLSPPSPHLSPRAGSPVPTSSAAPPQQQSEDLLTPSRSSSHSRSSSPQPKPSVSTSSHKSQSRIAALRAKFQGSSD
ncbi:Eisosome component PIL1-domain-containing protein [Gongronella butleri]|nr:Eisosome component PIL1-domain-containing protein [Gongronella butleri]